MSKDKKSPVHGRPGPSLAATWRFGDFQLRGTEVHTYRNQSNTSAANFRTNSRFGAPCIGIITPYAYLDNSTRCQTSYKQVQCLSFYDVMHEANHFFQKNYWCAAALLHGEKMHTHKIYIYCNAPAVSFFSHQHLRSRPRPARRTPIGSPRTPLQPTNRGRGQRAIGPGIKPAVRSRRSGFRKITVVNGRAEQSKKASSMVMPC